MYFRSIQQVKSMIELKFIDVYIKRERNEIKFYSIFSTVVLCAGLTLLLVGFQNSNTIEIGKISGLLITAFTGFPVSRVLYIRKRISTFEILKELKDEISKEDLEEFKKAIMKDLTSILEKSNSSI